MTRVAVIGNAGGGKSTLCRVLSRAHGLEVLVIDHVQWLPGWVPAPDGVVREALNLALARERWIIDGWGPLDTIAARFAVADTIIVVDHPLWVHYRWAIKRQLASLVRERDDGPPGCPMLPMTWPMLLSLVEAHRDGRIVIHLRSPHVLRAFLKQHMCSV